MTALLLRFRMKGYTIACCQRSPGEQQKNSGDARVMLSSVGVGAGKRERSFDRAQAGKPRQGQQVAAYRTVQA